MNNITPDSGFVVKRGPADPFRGSWYDHDMQFESLETAVQYAFMLTVENWENLGRSWEEFGYEWAVFEVGSGQKIWEGYCCMQHHLRGETPVPEASAGYL